MVVLVGRFPKLDPVFLRLTLHIVHTQVEQVCRVCQAQPAFRNAVVLSVRSSLL